MNTNIKSAFQLTKRVLPHMIDAEQEYLFIYRLLLDS